MMYGRHALETDRAKFAANSRAIFFFFDAIRALARDPRGSRERDDDDEKSQRRFAADRALARFACGGWMAWLVALEIFDRRW